MLSYYKAYTGRGRSLKHKEIQAQEVGKREGKKKEEKGKREDENERPEAPKRTPEHPKTTPRRGQEAHKSEPEPQDDKRTAPRAPRGGVPPVWCHPMGSIWAPKTRPKPIQKASQNEVTNQEAKKRSKVLKEVPWSALGHF